MIALYYCYPPGGIPPDRLEPHVAFHRETCAALDLGGRIRVSEEGINGVLSGTTEDDLRAYERRLRRELAAMHVASSGRRNLAANDGDDEIDEDEIDDDEREEDPTADWLDVKYCRLRGDVPAEEQLFESLSVKITREVVSLMEPAVENENGGGRNKGRPRCRQRRKQRRKEKRRLEGSRGEGDGGTAGCGKESNVGERESGPTAIEGKNAADAEARRPRSLEEELESASIGRGSGRGPAAARANGDDDAEPGTALPIGGWRGRAPAAHLSPRRWNDELLRLSRREGPRDPGGDGADGPPAGGGAVLLDARNVYETRVGHFAVPGLETFFPNTRKFSSLPGALNTEEAARALAGKEVFMYCTGGVRCERAGSYLRALSESNAGAWKGKARPKGIYQLRGGIQKYLESYGRDEDELANAAKDTENATRHESGNDRVECIATADDRRTEESCLYRGKNFVFDPRRTDPLVGRGIAGDDAGAGGRVSVVGRCVACSAPHDDYDNGHAPREDREARCCRCRVLVLVCDDCRGDVRCWGEPAPDDGDGRGDDAGIKTALFCGHGGGVCVDEGNIAGKVETARF